MSSPSDNEREICDTFGTIVQWYYHEERAQQRSCLTFSHEEKKS